MSMFRADDPADTTAAWALLAGQAVLLVALVVLPGGDAWSTPTWLWDLARWVQWIGAGALVLGLLNLGVSVSPLPSPVPDGRLQTWGLFRLVRHPIYSGIMALALGRAAQGQSLVVVGVAVALTAWLAAKARWEERRLADRYDDYADYCAITPRFVPLWPRHPAPGA